MSIVATSALSTGLVTIRKPVTPKSTAATKWWKKPAQCPTMTA